MLVDTAEVLKERIKDKLIGHYPTSLEYGAGVVVQRFGPFTERVKQHFNTTKLVPERLHWACQNTFYCLNKKEILLFFSLLVEHKFSKFVSVDYAPIISPRKYKKKQLNEHIKEAPAFAIIVEQMIFLAKNQANIKPYFDEEKLYAYIYKPVLAYSPHIEMVAFPDPSSLKKEQEEAQKRGIYLVQVSEKKQQKYMYDALFSVSQQINSKSNSYFARLMVEPISAIDLWYQAIIRYAHNLGLATNLVRLVISFKEGGTQGPITSALSCLSETTQRKKSMEDAGCELELISDIFSLGQGHNVSHEVKIGKGHSKGSAFVLKITPGAR